MIHIGLIKEVKRTDRLNKGLDKGSVVKVKIWLIFF